MLAWRSGKADGVRSTWDHSREDFGPRGALGHAVSPSALVSPEVNQESRKSLLAYSLSCWGAVRRVVPGTAPRLCREPALPWVCY